MLFTKNDHLNNAIIFCENFTEIPAAVVKLFMCKVWLSMHKPYVKRGSVCDIHIITQTIGYFQRHVQ
jgi:hypothetical protein